MPICANCAHYKDGHPNYGHDDYKAGWCSRIKVKRDEEYESNAYPGVHIFLDNPFEAGNLLVDPMFGCMLYEPAS